MRTPTHFNNRTDCMYTVTSVAPFKCTLHTASKMELNPLVIYDDLEKIPSPDREPIRKIVSEMELALRD